MKYLVLFLVVLFFSCLNNKQQSKTIIGLSDFHSNETNQEYVSNDTSRIYLNIGSDTVLSTLKIGDSIIVESEPQISNETYFSKWYKVHLKINSNETSGFICGNNIAHGSYIDIDDDGKNELIIFGYEKYKNEDDDDPYDNPAFLKVLKEGKLFFDYKFQGYSTIIIEKVNAGFTPHIPVLSIHIGLAACDYPNYDRYIYYKDQKFHDILQSVSMGNEFGGEGSVFIFPNDSLGKPNKILEFRSLIYNFDNENDERSPSDTNRFDTSIYEFKNLKFIKVYQSNNIK